MKNKKNVHATYNIHLLLGLEVVACLLTSRPLRRLPLLFAGAVAILLAVFAFISLLSPPITNHQLYHTNRHSLNTVLGVRENVQNEIVFRVPKHGGSLIHELWSSSNSKYYYGCSNASRDFQSAELKTNPDWYLMIATSGGLNQQRTGIIDAVVAAYILNATLVVPNLDKNSYWKDKSNFSEIFNIDWFISYLSKDVKIIKQLPERKGNVMTPHNMRVPRKCDPTCYVNRVSPVLKKKNVVQLTKFDYRLSNQLENNLQKLRCRVNYHALMFTDSILQMGRKMVERMRMKSKDYISLHLRFESDMLAFSGCDYGGGEKERIELGAMRKRWKTLHKSNPDKERRQGKCPLSPEEVGLMLRALGFGSDVHIYVASGELYGGEETLAPLKALFPNFHTKETIASAEELAPFSTFSSRMAALDFIVCEESSVFVSNNNGNMARMLAGRRRYFGHKPTIRPNAKKLYQLFMNRNNMAWEEFSSRVRTLQIGFMGEPNEVKPGRGEFHENPSSCICEYPDTKLLEDSISRTQDTIGNKYSQEFDISKFTNEDLDEQSGEDEHDISNPRDRTDNKYGF
ncbi:protein ROOT HAIR SPECIFIC 17 [Apium graveolens]|uniref:protein ROOT HAIR SPECIFIC 17 n=1 Tax=Apium graveolens TaxID=4045 RepID=UPI003D791B8D